MSKNMTKIVCLAAFSRTDLLRESLESIAEARRHSNYLLLVLQQDSNIEVSKILKDFEQQIDYMIHTQSMGKSALQNINLNRIKCYEYSFDFLKADYVVAIEDDTVISEDSLKFVDFAMDKYCNNPLYRGVNLGSKEVIGTNETYSLLRYGLMGQAAGLPLKTWKNFKIEKLKKKSLSLPFDSLLESYLKSGFMVTPNRSKMYDRGWEGTHFNTSQSDIHFAQMKASWLGYESGPIPTSYNKLSIPHFWRKDSVTFKLIDQPKYYLIYLISNFRQIELILRILLRAVKRIVRN